MVQHHVCCVRVCRHIRARHRSRYPRRCLAEGSRFPPEIREPGSAAGFRTDAFRVQYILGLHLGLPVFVDLVCKPPGGSYLLSEAHARSVAVSFSGEPDCQLVGSFCGAPAIRCKAQHASAESNQHIAFIRALVGSLPSHHARDVDIPEAGDFRNRDRLGLSCAFISFVRAESCEGSLAPAERSNFGIGETKSRPFVKTYAMKTDRVEQ